MSEFDDYRLCYEQAANEAVAYTGKSHAFYLEVKDDILAELLRRHFGDTRLDLLDVGCGNGMLHGFLLASGLPSA